MKSRIPKKKLEITIASSDARRCFLHFFSQVHRIEFFKSVFPLNCAQTHSKNGPMTYRQYPTFYPDFVRQPTLRRNGDQPLGQDIFDCQHLVVQSSGHRRGAMAVLAPKAQHRFAQRRTGMRGVGSVTGTTPHGIADGKLCYFWNIQNVSFLSTSNP